MSTQTGLRDAKGYDGQLSNTLVAIFATSHDAHAAIKELHKAGFRQTWLGVMNEIDHDTGAAIVDEGGLARFLSPDRVSLSKALLKRGVSEEQALEVEEDIAIGCAVITVYGEDNPDRAADLLSGAKGHVIAGSAPSAVALASENPRVGVEKTDKTATDWSANEAAMRGRDASTATLVDDEPDYLVEEFYSTGR
jgi:hypothetical protein